MQRSLGDPQPAAPSDDDGRTLSAPLLADAAVADVDDPVGDRRRAWVVTDDERRDTLLPGELCEERVDGCGAHLVELAGGLVRNQQARPVRQRGAEGDPLLLATGELAREGTSPVAQADSLEQAVSARETLRLPGALEPERHRDQLLRSQLAGQRPPVVLVGVAERSGPVVGQAPLGQRSELDARDDDGAGARPLEPRKHAHQRGLPRPTRTENDTDLALSDIERQTLKCRDASAASRIDAEQVAGLDEAHAPTSCARAGPRSSRNARRVASATSAAATSR